MGRRTSAEAEKLARTIHNLARLYPEHFRFIGRRYIAEFLGINNDLARQYLRPRNKAAFRAGLFK